MEEVYDAEVGIDRKIIPLEKQVASFNATVTPTVLYGCAAWALTKELDKKVKRTQRRMLRFILRAGWGFKMYVRACAK